MLEMNYLALSGIICCFVLLCHAQPHRPTWTKSFCYDADYFNDTLDSLYNYYEEYEDYEFNRTEKDHIRGALGRTIEACCDTCTVRQLKDALGEGYSNHDLVTWEDLAYTAFCPYDIHSLHDENSYCTCETTEKPQDQDSGQIIRVCEEDYDDTSDTPDYTPTTSEYEPPTSSLGPNVGPGRGPGSGSRPPPSGKPPPPPSPPRPPPADPGKRSRSEDDDDGPDVALIGGIVGGLVLLVLAVIIAVFAYRRWGRTSKRKPPTLPTHREHAVVYRVSDPTGRAPQHSAHVQNHGPLPERPRAELSPHNKKTRGQSKGNSNEKPKKSHQQAKASSHKHQNLPVSTPQQQKRGTASDKPKKALHPKKSMPHHPQTLAVPEQSQPKASPSQKRETHADSPRNLKKMQGSKATPKPAPSPALQRQSKSEAKPKSASRQSTKPTGAVGLFTNRDNMPTAVPNDYQNDALNKQKPTNNNRYDTTQIVTLTQPMPGGASVISGYEEPMRRMGTPELSASSGSRRNPPVNMPFTPNIPVEPSEVTRTGVLQSLENKAQLQANPGETDTAYLYIDPMDVRTVVSGPSLPTRMM